MSDEKIYFPLRNFFPCRGCCSFESNKPFSLQLDSNTKIVSISEVPIPVQNRIKSSYNPLYTNFVIETLRDKNKNYHADQGNLDRTVIIFDLFKDNLVISNEMILEKGEYANLIHHHTWYGETIAPYYLKEFEESEFVDFWNIFRDIPLVFPVRRFHYAMFQAYGYYTFFDYVSLLDSMFKESKDDSSKNSKFSTRGAVILVDKNYANLKEDMKDVVGTLKELYNIRNSLAHSDEHATNRNDWPEKNNILRRYVRESIKCFHIKGWIGSPDKKSEGFKDIIKKVKQYKLEDYFNKLASK